MNGAYTQEVTRRCSAKPSLSFFSHPKRTMMIKCALSSSSHTTCARAGHHGMPPRSRRSLSLTMHSRSDSKSNSRTLARRSTANFNPCRNCSNSWTKSCRWTRTRMRKKKHPQRSVLRVSADRRVSRLTVRTRRTSGLEHHLGGKAARLDQSAVPHRAVEDKLTVAYRRRRTSQSDDDEDDDNTVGGSPSALPTRSMPRRAAYVGTSFGCD